MEKIKNKITIHILAEAMYKPKSNKMVHSVLGVTKAFQNLYRNEGKLLYRKYLFLYKNNYLSFKIGLYLDKLHNLIHRFPAVKLAVFAFWNKCYILLPKFITTTYIIVGLISWDWHSYVLHPEFIDRVCDGTLIEIMPKYI